MGGTRGDAQANFGDRAVLAIYKLALSKVLLNEWINYN